ncbi:transposase [Streptomyces sp. NPDC050759]|uniref:transposase n=1 Tax=Streptomyces sp. NPDC050759 TaxID=3365635 RepID=UPI0037AB3307
MSGRTSAIGCTRRGISLIALCGRDLEFLADRAGSSGLALFGGGAGHQAARASLTDVQWARIEPLLPDRTPKRGGRTKRGGRWRDHRQVIEAVAWTFRTGSPRDSMRPASARLALSADARRRFTEFAAR